MKAGAKQPRHRPATRTLANGPFDSFPAMHGLKGLQPRMKAHCASAPELAKWLEQHPAVERMICPGFTTPSPGRRWQSVTCTVSARLRRHHHERGDGWSEKGHPQALGDQRRVAAVVGGR
jgi:cystathionine beta-lyase/cystathionine gamma-synthase